MLKQDMNVVLQKYRELLDCPIGLKRYFVLFVLGTLSSLALAPFHFVPILFITLPCFFLMFKGVHAFKDSFVFFLGYFVVGLYWVAMALLTDIGRYWWALPLAVLGLPVLLSMFHAVPMIFMKWCDYKSVTTRFVLFACLWSIGEGLRGHLFTGFPWNLLGYSWSSDAGLFVLQSVKLWGIYGLSFVTVILCGLFIVLQKEKVLFFKIWYSLFCIGVVAVIVYFGQNLFVEPQVTQHMTVRLIQPNISQIEKWDADFLHRNIQNLVDLSSEEGLDQVDMVVWPETSVALFGEADQKFFKNLVSRILMNEKQFLVAGVLAAYDQNTLRNGIDVWDHAGVRVAMYDKSHLVPFGEYLPFQKYWPIDPIASGGSLFQPGQGVKTISVSDGDIRFSPLVCYEVIFPHKVVDQNNRPDFIINVTNDAWYGYSSGPFQHLAIARVRAIEEGIPLIRVANTGISAVIDSVGRVIGHIPLETRGFLDVSVPLSMQ